MTCADSPSTTSSPESVDGQSPCGTQDGLMTDLFGQVLAPAKTIAAPEKKPANQGSVTYGRIGSGSSASAALTSFMANRLQAQLAQAGLMTLPMGWKRKNTPSRRLFYQLVPLADSIDATDCGLWQTPSRDSFRKRGGSRSNELGNETMIKEALWHTPRAVMPEEAPEQFRARMNSKRANDRKDGLPNLAVQALWATPQARDHRTGESERWGHPERSKNLNDQAVAMWATPNTMDSMDTRSPEAMEKMYQTQRKGRNSPSNLREQVNPSMWPTPGAHDNRNRGNYNNPCIQKRVESGKQIDLSMIAQASAGLNAQTEKSGQLNPEFVCWLMGYPVAWLFAAPRDKAKPRFKNTGITEPGRSPDSAMPSTRRPRHSSSSQPKDGSNETV